MKRKGISIVVAIAAVIALSCAVYVFAGTQNAKNLMWEYLDEKGYAQAEIQDIAVSHSFLNIILSYQEWNIKVIYNDEPTSTYSYHIEDGRIVEGGVSGSTNKEDLTHQRKQVVKNDPIELSQEQIEEVNMGFEPMIPVEHEEYEYMVNLICHFFGSSYEKPQDMDFTEFIWYFSTQGMMDQPEISEQEFELLKELENFPFDNVQSLSDMPVPIQRKPLKEVNEVLEQYMGITAADLNTEDIPYLGEPYDAFYTYTSDAGFMGFNCTGGEIAGDTVRLFSDYATLTLQKRGDSYRIVSHVKAEDGREASANAGQKNEKDIHWQTFIEEMEEQGVSYDNLHTLESSGIPRKEIMQMTALDIWDKIAEIQKIIKQNKADLAREMLEDWENVKSDPQFVYSDATGTTNLHLVEDFMQSVAANDWGSFTGLIIGSPIPIAYEMAYQPDKNITLTTYTNSNGFQEREQVVTDLYDAGTFYHFTDHETLYFSIPKLSQIDKEVQEDYLPDSDLPGAAVTAMQAKKRATEVAQLVMGYLQYARETHGKNAMNGYGVLVPEGFDAPAELPATWRPVTDGAAVIQGVRYYQVSFYDNEMFAGESYYIDAETMKTIFMVSMVDGKLIPISCGNADA